MKFWNELHEEIESEVGERIVVLRHDVDNIYGIYRPGFRQKIVKPINYALLALMTLSVKLRYLIPFYENHIQELLDVESKYGAKASYFFRVITLPRQSLLRKLIAEGHEIGYHSDRNSSFHQWFGDLKTLERELNVHIHGFTKHGHSLVRDGGIVEEDLLINYASKAKLLYFAQGEGHEDWNLPKKINNVWVFGHHITLKKASIENVRKYLERCIPLILIHPEDIFIKGERAKLEYVLANRKGISVINLIRIINKISGEESYPRQ